MAISDESFLILAHPSITNILEISLGPAGDRSLLTLLHLSLCPVLGKEGYSVWETVYISVKQSLWKVKNNGHCHMTNDCVTYVKDRIYKMSIIKYQFALFI